MTSLGQRKLSPAEAVGYLAERGIEVHEDTVRRWCRQEAISCVRLPGGRFLISTDVLDQLAEPRPVQAAS